MWAAVPVAAKAPDATAVVSPRPAAVIAAATAVVRIRWVRPDGAWDSCGWAAAVAVLRRCLRNFIFVLYLFL